MLHFTVTATVRAVAAVAVTHHSSTVVGVVSAAHAKWVISGFCLGIFMEQRLYFRVLNGFHSTTLFSFNKI
jgi:hypothetical protein